MVTVSTRKSACGNRAVGAQARTRVEKSRHTVLEPLILLKRLGMTVWEREGRTGWARSVEVEGELCGESWTTRPQLGRG